MSRGSAAGSAARTVDDEAVANDDVVLHGLFSYPSGTVSGVDHARASLRRRRFSAELAACFEQVDLIACPSYQAAPPPLTALPHQTDDASWQDLIKFSAPYDFSGSPTLSVPNGCSSEGLPLSLQLVARHREESLLFRAGHAFEGATEWHTRHPPEPAGVSLDPTNG